MNKKQRLISFDLLKFAAIFLVIWGHTIQYFLSSPPDEEVVYRIIYSFHMPLFMMVAGFFAYHKVAPPHQDNSITFFLQKARELLLPVLIWSALFLSYDIYNNHVNGVETDICQLVINSLLNKLWFLKTIFVCYVLIWLAYTKVWKYEWLGLIVVLVISQALPFIANLAILFPAFIVGLLIKRLSVLPKLDKKIIMLCGFAYVVLIVVKEMDIIQIGMICRGVNILLGIFASLFFVGLFSHCFDKTKTEFSLILAEWGGLTLEIYIMQTLILETILAKYVSLDSINPIVCNVILFPLITVMVLILCILTIKLIKKSSILDLVLFGKLHPKEV